jgi:PAS domain S-box-containing protein
MSSLQSKPIVLIVDDDKTTRFILRGILEQDGFEIIEAGDGADALAIVEQTPPDVVLMDVTMPIMDGFETCMRLRGLPMGEQIPILMITARSDVPSVNRAFEVGATDYITKPIHHTVLRRRVRRILSARRAEQARQESEEYFRLLAENAHDVIYRYRLIPTPEYEYVSPAITAITGYVPGEFYADSTMGAKLVHPEDRPLLQAIVRDVETSSKEVAMRWVCKDGEIVWVDLRNVPVYNEKGVLTAIEGIARDITGRKQAEDTLLENQKRYQLLFNSSYDAIFVYQLAESGKGGKFLEVNDSACRILGYAREELLTLSCHEINASKSLADIEMMADDLKIRKDIIFETVHVTKNGAKIPVEISAHLFEMAGQATVLSVARELTGRI